MHREIIRRYKVVFTQQEFRISALVAILVFILSVVANYAASAYATQRASNYVEDIILSNIPVFDVGWFFVYGASSLIVFIVFLCLPRPNRIPFVLYAFSLFYLIRAVFVSLTHLGPFPTQAELDVGELALKFFGGDDMFFSGHTGAPFLMALIFWQNRALRYLFLAWSVFFGVVVLLGHLHYTIDVLAAFFITYGIYHLALWLFPKDYTLFRSES